MSKNFKLQSAMEYLMTYGWALLVIAIVLVALFALGVFNGSSFLSTSCVASSGYICSQPVALPNGASSVMVTINFGQNTGSTAYNAVVALAPQSSALNSAGYPTTITTNSLGTLSAGSIQSINFLVPSTEFTSTNAIGSQFSGYVWLNYSTVGPNSPSSSAVKTATIIVKVT